MEIGNIGRKQVTQEKIQTKAKDKGLDCQVGEDKIEIGKENREYTPPVISMPLAVDKNGNQKIESEEIIKSNSELSDRDKNGDDKLTRQNGELGGVYFGYSKDKWLPADKINYETMDGGYKSKIEMKELDIKTGQVNMDISMQIDHF
ncbi:MAG: hypothetical protein ABRQ39_11880 [Candidatus Eremiobacterota bacterium]